MTVRLAYLAYLSWMFPNESKINLIIAFLSLAYSWFSRKMSKQPYLQKSVSNVVRNNVGLEILIVW